MQLERLPVFKIIMWVGTILNVAGSFLVASKMFFAGYVLFMVASVIWIFQGMRNRDFPLLTLNAFFLAANALGLYNNT